MLHRLLRRKSALIFMLMVLIWTSVTPGLVNASELEEFALQEGHDSFVRMLETDEKMSEPAQKIAAQLQVEFQGQEYVTYLIKLKEQVDVEEVSRQALQYSMLRKETPAKRKLAVRSYVIHSLIDTAERTQQNIVDELEHYRLDGSVVDYHSYFIVNALSITSDRKTMEQLAARQDVEVVVPNQTYTLHYETVEPAGLSEIVEQAAVDKNIDHLEQDRGAGQEEQKLESENNPIEIPWNLRNINVPEAWKLGLDGTGIVVANMDSGVDLEHPALKNKWRGNDSLEGVNLQELSWYDATSERKSSPYDGNGHGTHVMGTMVGSEEGGLNPIGVAPQAKWIAARVFDSDGNATDAGILEAGEWILAPRDARGQIYPELAPDIVNNSWGNVVAGKNEFFQEIVKAWREANIFPAFSVGNTSEYNAGGHGSATPPGNYPESFATGAVDSNNKLASFSLWGPSPYGEVKPEVTAPGVRIRSAFLEGKYALLSGTSMASPHTAGVAALVLQANPSLTVDELETVLLESAVPLTNRQFPETPNHGYGWGLINALNAVSMVQDGLELVEGQVTIAGEDSGIPEIEHSPIKLTFNVLDQEIYAQVKDEISVVKVELLVRSMGEEDWEILPMKRVYGDHLAGLYEGVIPVSLLALEGIEYRLRAVDFGGNSVETDIFQVEVSEGVRLGYRQDFEESIDGFDFGGDPGIWEWGVPTSGPGQAFTGSKVLATKLDGNYPVGIESYFVVPLIDLREEEEALLSFTHWFRPGNWMGAIFDRADIFIGTESSGFQFEIARTFNWRTDGWATDYVDLTPYAGERIFVIFHLSGLNGSAEGWYIDHIEVIESDERPPDAPQIKVRSNTPGRVIVEWPQEPQGEIKEYVIYRSTEADGEFEEIGTSRTRNFGEMPIPQKGTYYYMVRAKTHSNVLSSNSNVVHWTFTGGNEIFSDDFEGENLGWTRTGEVNDWEHGAPNPGYFNGPKEAVSGANVWGTNLSGIYSKNANQSLVSPRIDLAEEEQAVVYFQHWYDFDDGDRGYVEISKDGGETWSKLTEFPKIPSDSMHPRRFWYLNEAAIGEEYLGQQINIRFRLQSGGNSLAPGWYIDDFEVRESSPVKSGALEFEVKEGEEGEYQGTEGFGIEEVDTLKSIELSSILKDKKANQMAQQTTSSAVLSSQGSVLPAKATITVLETNRSTRTDLGTGKYALKHPLGTYNLRVEAYGYKPIDQEVRIERNQTTRMDFHLEPLGQGEVAGVISDMRGRPITGATIRVMEDAHIPLGVTNEEGEFTLSGVYEGEYTLLVSALGYLSEQAQVRVLANESVTKAFRLFAFKGHPDELVYDDGTADNALAFRSAGNALAVRMTTEERVQISGASFYFWDGGWPDPGGSEFTYALFDASDPEGMPGQLLSGPHQGQAQLDGSWTEVAFQNPAIIQGDFYIAYIQSGEFPEVPGLGADRTGPSYGRSWKMEQGSWRQAALSEGNFMIRGKITSIEDAPIIFSPVDGESSASPLVMVEGAYPQEGANVTIFNHEDQVGTGVIQDGLFSIEIELTAEYNELYAIAEKDGVTSAPSAKVKVHYAPEIAGIDVSPKDLQLLKGQETQLIVLARNRLNDPKDVTELAQYEAEDDSVIRLNERGKVTAVGLGETEIIVSYSGFKDRVSVTVTEPEHPEEEQLLSIAVEPNPMSLLVGESKALSVSAVVYSQGEEKIVPVIEGVSFLSVHPSVAGVDESGLVSGQKQGETMIQVQVQNLMETVKVTVENNDADPGPNPDPDPDPRPPYVPEPPEYWTPVPIYPSEREAKEKIIVEGREIGWLASKEQEGLKLARITINEQELKHQLKESAGKLTLNLSTVNLLNYDSITIEMGVSATQVLTQARQDVMISAKPFELTIPTAGLADFITKDQFSIILALKEGGTAKQALAIGKEAFPVSHALTINNSSQKISQPLKLTLKLHPTGIQDQRKAGIYQQNKQGKWSFSGRSDIAHSGISQQLTELGTYTALEYTRTFADIAAHWAREEIEVLASQHLTVGKNDYQFAPNDPITKAEFMILLDRLTEQEIEEVRRFNEPGAKELLRREEMVVMLVSAMDGQLEFEADTVELELPFADASAISKEARFAVAYAYDQGLIKGVSGNRFAGHMTTTRAEIATLLYRVLYDLEYSKKVK